MADDLKVKVQLEANMDKNQVEKEVKWVADTAQKMLDKKELKIKIEDNIQQLKKKLEEARVAYQNLLNQPMNWTTDRQLAQLEDHMEDLRNEIKENEKALGDMWVAGNKLWGTLTKLATKFSALAIAGKALSFLKNLFNDFQKAQKTLVMATGASWEALQQLTRDMLAVQGQVSQNQWEIAEAIWELNTRLWLTGQELQDFTTKYLKFASVTGQDGKTAIENNVKLFAVWWVEAKKQAEYLDKLTVAGQKTWISVSELTNKLQQNAPVLQELGFSLDDSIALMSNFEKSWIEASQVLMSMKIAIKNLVDDGLSPAEALTEIIKWVEDGTISMNEAMEIFGSRWGVAMINAIRNGTFQLSEMKESLSDVSWAVEETRNEMETLWEFISRKRNKALGDFVNWNNEGFQATRKLYHIIKDELTPTFEKAKEETTKWTNVIMQLIKWERDLEYQDWKLIFKLNEKWKAAEEARHKQEALTKATNDLRAAGQALTDWLKEFNSIKVDDSATRAEFEASRKRALELAASYETTLRAKIALMSSDINSSEMVSVASINKRNQLNAHLKAYMELKKEVNSINKSVYTWSWKSGWWWAVGDALFWWSGGWGWWWSKKSKAEEMAESFKKEMSDLYSEMDSEATSHESKLKSVKDSIAKIENEYQKLRENAKKTREDAEKSLKNYNDQLEKAQSSAITSLWQRYVELKKELMDVDRWMKEVAENTSWDEIQNNINDWRWYIWGYDLKDIMSLKEKLDEMKLIEENTTEEQRKSEEFVRKTSKAQEILNNLKAKELEIEEKKAQAIEKQKIAEAVMNQWTGDNFIKQMQAEWEEMKTYYYDVATEKREQIHNVDNIEYAKQLSNQITSLSDQLAEFQKEKDQEVEILTSITSRKIALENDYNKTFQENIAKQKASVDQLIRKRETLIAKKNEYYGGSWSARAYGWDISNAKVTLVWENWPEQIIARQASYVQPRNASNSYSTVNNTDNSFSINWMQVNVNNIDEFLDDLKQKMTYRN